MTEEQVKQLLKVLDDINQSLKSIASYIASAARVYHK